jgi:hypothetical protein
VSDSFVVVDSQTVLLAADGRFEDQCWVRAVGREQRFAVFSADVRTPSHSKVAMSPLGLHGKMWGEEAFGFVRHDTLKLAITKNH